MKCFQTETRLLAAMVPEAETAGMPMPGNTESPQRVRPDKGQKGRRGKVKVDSDPKPGRPAAPAC